VVALVVKAIVVSNLHSRVVPVITNDATSQMVTRVAGQYGVSVEEVEVGETNVVSLMNEKHSFVGGEGSNGGSIVAPGQCRDGLQALAIILRYLAEQKSTLDEELLHLPNFVTLALKAKCLGSVQQRVRIGMSEHYRTAGARVVTTGGQDGGVKAWVRPDAWVWWRASKTEAGVFRIIADAKDRHTAELLLREAQETFERLSKV
jgi:phosphomannomutase